LIETRASFEKVAEELGYLPLALDQAGAFIHAQQISADEYLPKFYANFKRVSSKTPKVGWQYDKALLNTWELSLDAISRINPVAPVVLTLCAFLGPEIVTTDMLGPMTDYHTSFHPDGPGTVFSYQNNATTNSLTLITVAGAAAFEEALKKTAVQTRCMVYFLSYNISYSRAYTLNSRDSSRNYRLFRQFVDRH
jgi:hypothetical protein